jgi:triosephosphate isomerase (TIM)
LTAENFDWQPKTAYWRDEGPFTGEVSFTMLRELVHYVIVGHSERRQVFQESLETIRDKTVAAVRNGITPILCIGETKHERQQGETKQVLHDQLMTGLSNLTAREVADAVIAYEPLWAISNGKDFNNHEIARPDQVAEAVNYIRSYVHDVFGPKASKNLRVLYGGSTTPDVVQGFLNVPGVDGFLVGGASLNYHSFSEIVANARRWQRSKDVEGV